jgi:XTP/dITP diphosphohydrolase
MSRESKRTLLVATFNSGKIREIEPCLANLGFQVVGLDSLPQASRSREDGRTFEANARQKAIHYSQFSEWLTVADDSGLQVDVLDGQPGVHSARLCGETATDAERCREILARLESFPEERRHASFVCWLALARRGQILEAFEGRVEGLIAREPRGKNGFGYDPIFWVPSLGRTMAELTLAEKAAVSHRGEALRKLVVFLRSARMRESLEMQSGQGF